MGFFCDELAKWTVTWATRILIIMISQPLCFILTNHINDWYLSAAPFMHQATLHYLLPAMEPFHHVVTLWCCIIDTQLSRRLPFKQGTTLSNIMWTIDNNFKAAETLAKKNGRFMHNWQLCCSENTYKHSFTQCTHGDERRTWWKTQTCRAESQSSSFSEI